MEKQVKQIRRGGVVDGEYADILRGLAAKSGKERKATVKWMLAEWAFFDLAGNWSLTAEALAHEAGTSTEAATRFLQNFSLAFGQPPERDPWPRATHELQTTPFVTYEDKFLLAAPHLLLWAVKPNIEAQLQSEPGAPWDSYEHARSGILVQKSLEHLRKVMPESTSFQSLFYDFDGKRCELDGLLIFDQYLFLIEGKAGVASAAARRGATKSIVSDLKDLVRDPGDQASRASEFVRSASTPIFSLKDGTKVPINKIASPEIITLSVTLDDMGIFTSDLSEIVEMGLVSKREPAWAIYLPDLMIAAEILQTPAMFLHYVGWRRSLFESRGVRCKDEVNWLGIYLKEGPEQLMPATDFQFLTFTTYTTDFDDYFLSQMGQRSKPAARPAPWMPKEMASLISQIEATNTWGYTRVTNALLDLTHSERKELGKLLRRRHKLPAVELQLEGTRTIITLTGGRSDTAWEEQAREAATSCRKTSVVLAFAAGSGKLEGWGVARP